MTNNDLKQIGALIDEKLSSTETRLKEEIQALRKDMLASDDALRKDMLASDDALRKDMLASDQQVTNNVGDFIENTLMPMINERFDAIDEKFDEKADKTDIDRLERKIDRLIDTDLDHERRIKDIEAIPVITHELKLKKSR